MLNHLKQPIFAGLSTLAFTLALPVSATTAHASTDEAWEAFRTEVHDACVELAPDEGETVIEVNPFGSESYGAALMITTLPDGAADRYVCIFDKKAKTVELTAAFAPPEPIAEAVAEPDGTIEAETVPHTEAELVDN
ncbi:hypothetical protein [Paracoccus tegillarcae]|uniref:Uncharacterized protein n=1 Tax=Paracoccus tegillarcae TaxID=1529068 RepID=A0A2K9EM21_9RHOB|nr:hypothetical protein [Paracoccus tegillarcae]AUH35499.1 hypothetical protein CUV01_15325 [Paracoccus tegillarcae]